MLIKMSVAKFYLVSQKNASFAPLSRQLQHRRSPSYKRRNSPWLEIFQYMHNAVVLVKKNSIYRKTHEKHMYAVAWIKP